MSRTKPEWYALVKCFVTFQSLRTYQRKEFNPSSSETAETLLPVPHARWASQLPFLALVAEAVFATAKEYT
jgi:hypothetical protein